MVIAVNSRLRMLGHRIVSVGFVDACPVDPREVFSFLVTKKASAFFVAHNHPSGDFEPSKPDVELTSRLAEGARILGMNLLDHFIVATGPGFCSFQERGQLVSYVRRVADGEP